MSYPASIEKALAYLQTLDIHENYKKGFFPYTLFWKNGIALPPPLCAGFFTNMAVFAIMTFVLMILLFPLFFWKWHDPLLQKIVSCVSVSLVGGFGSALSFRGEQKKFNIPKWKDLQKLPDHAQNRDG